MSARSAVLNFGLRGAQALFALVIFALSTSLIRGHHLGSLPSTLGFAAFVGGLSFIGALVGVAAQWMVVVQGQVGVMVDAVVGGINIAGGILMAVKLKDTSCSNIKSYSLDSYEAEKVHHLIWNDVVCGGVKKIKGSSWPYCYYYKQSNWTVLTSRCKMSQADSAFMFLTSVVVVAMAVIGFLRMRKGY